MTVGLFVCRLCRGQGTLISLRPAPGFACVACVKKHGKERLIQAALEHENQSIIVVGKPIPS